jgi:hypothetical protein
LVLTFANAGFGAMMRTSETRTPARALPRWIAGKDRSFHGFLPHLSHNVATFWVKDMQCFVDWQRFAAAANSCYGEADNVVTARRLCPFGLSASGGVA